VYQIARLCNSHAWRLIYSNDVIVKVVYRGFNLGKKIIDKLKQHPSLAEKSSYYSY